MTIDKGNIIQFPTGKTPPKDQSQQTIKGVQNKIYTLEKTPSQFVLYSERNTRNYLHASDFFRILLSHNSVCISTNNTSEITYDSIMSVTDDNGLEYQLPVDYFIRMTTEFPSKIGNDMQSILDHISNLNIRIGMYTGDPITTKTILTEEELEGYRPEQILGITGINNYYICELYREFGLPIGCGEVEMFDIIHHSITLLDFMILSMEDTELSGYKIEGANMEVISIEGDDTIITTISSGLLERVIHNSLKRINPLLYSNMAFRNAHQYYFQKVVVPKIRPESEQTDLDE